MRSGRVVHGRRSRENRGSLQATKKDRSTRGIQQPIAGCIKTNIRLQPGEIGT